MAMEIAKEEPEPKKQTGDIVPFKRRNPSQSVLPTDVNSLEKIYDHIRMLDCEGYPRAFVDIGNTRLIFQRAALKDGAVVANVAIRMNSTKH